MKVEMSIFRLTVLSLCLFVASDILVCATEPAAISDRTSSYFSNEIVDMEDFITVNFQRHDTASMWLTGIG